MKAAVTAVLMAAVFAGCGGGKSGTTTTAPPVASVPSTTPATVPTATTNTPPTATRTTPEPVPDAAPSPTTPLKVGSSYTCGGKPLKGIESADAVKVKPKVVKPGQSFQVFITDPKVKVATVSLTGVSNVPIQANAKEVAGEMAATLKMPSHAGCGNKLIEVEGDISAEAYVGVTD